MNLTLEIAPLIWIETEVDGDIFVTAEFPVGGMLEEEGYPAVPVAGQMFRIPARSGVTVEVISADYETFERVTYPAYKGEHQEYKLGRPDEIADQWFPGDLATIAPPAILHDFRVSNVLTYPVQVNTATGEVRVYSNIQLEVRFEGVDERNALRDEPTRISRAYLPWYRQFADWNENELDEYELYRGTVQVVMRNNNQLRAALEPWIEWKEQKGWILEYITDSDVNWNSAAIRSEIIDRYDDTNSGVDYIVIVGDNGGLFSTPAGAGHGDHYYGRMNNDDLMDVAVGRISVEDLTDVRTYVNKVLSYEKNPDLDNTGWYHRGQVAVASTSSGISTVFVERYHRHAMLNIGYTQVDTAWVSPWGNGNVNNRSIDRFNNGISFYSCRGYISAGLSTNQIDNLNNDFMTPVCIDITCGTGNWDTGYGINEAYMRAGSPNTPQGGIGAMGTATSSTHTRFNNCMAGGSGMAMLVLRTPTLGDVLFGGKVAMWKNFYGRDGLLSSFNEWYNLMGDPTVWVWSDVPHVLDVEAPGAIQLGQHGYEVAVYDDNGNPLKDAWVTLYKSDNDEEEILRGLSDQHGMVIFPITFEHPGTAVLTVTSLNFAPFQVEIDVNSADDFITYSQIEYQDDGENGTIGNDNGIPEAGETVGLIVTAYNFGESTATNVSLTVESSDQTFAEISGTTTFGDIASGEEATGEGLVLVTFSPYAQNEWKAHLSLNFGSDQGEYSDDLAIDVVAPDIGFVNIYGATNFDRGDTRDVFVRLRNVGDIDQPGCTGILYSHSPWVTVDVAEAEWDVMEVNRSVNGTDFVISAANETFDGHIAELSIVVSFETGFIDTVYFTLPCGTMAASDPSGPDSYGYYAYDNSDNGYELAPEFNWVEINPDEPDADFPGTRLDINDTGDNDDEAVVVDLPFPIQYYGTLFNQITVCSNGFLAMGSQADQPNMRNWTIPSPLVRII